MRLLDLGVLVLTWILLNVRQESMQFCALQ